MVKFHFSILAQNRLKIDSIAIMGINQEHAERKLRQMYRHCEVLGCEIKNASARPTHIHTQVVEDRASAGPFFGLLSA